MFLFGKTTKIFFLNKRSSRYVPYFCYYDKLRIAGKYLISNFQKLFQVKLNPEIFRFLTWNLEKVVKPINKSIKFPSVLEPPTLQNKSNSKGAFLYLCVFAYSRNNSWDSYYLKLQVFWKGHNNLKKKISHLLWHNWVNVKTSRRLFKTFLVLSQCLILYYILITSR